jgi:hypothetical protein
MKTLRGAMTAAALAAFLVTLGMAQSEAATANSSFDGAWSVLIQTVEGKCGSYRAVLHISGGQVSSEQGDYAVSGTVSANGATAVTVINNDGSATGSGRLRGPSGSGQWRSSSGACSGTWTATRRQ